MNYLGLTYPFPEKILNQNYNYNDFEKMLEKGKVGKSIAWNIAKFFKIF